MWEGWGSWGLVRGLDSWDEGGEGLWEGEQVALSKCNPPTSQGWGPGPEGPFCLSLGWSLGCQPFPPRLLSWRPSRAHSIQGPCELMRGPFSSETGGREPQKAAQAGPGQPTPAHIPS